MPLKPDIHVWAPWQVLRNFRGTTTTTVTLNHTIAPLHLSYYICTCTNTLVILVKKLVSQSTKVDRLVFISDHFRIFIRNADILSKNITFQKHTILHM